MSSVIASSVAGAAEAQAAGASAAEAAAASLELEIISEEAALAATEATVVSLEAAEFAALAAGPLGWITAAFIAVLAASTLVILQVESAGLQKDQVQHDYYVVHSNPPPPLVPVPPQPPTVPVGPNIINSAVQQVQSVNPSSYTRVIRGRRYNCIYFPFSKNSCGSPTWSPPTDYR